jgi:hypothetical protein
LPALNRGQSEKSDWPFPLYARVERTLLSAAVGVDLGFGSGFGFGVLVLLFFAS